MISLPRLLFYLVISLFTICLAFFMYLMFQEKEPLMERPASVPADAVPAIGADGGSWARCEYAEPPSLYCETYHSSDGAVYSRGNYVLSIDGETSDSRDEVPIADLMSGFSLFDGKYLYLESGARLVPDGVIDSPFRGDGGKKTVYSLGEIVSDEKQY